eukprot:CAMPEP_0184520414 /NCGR_PEP_ID=MMETSP0198_2-20121128/7151_1 /TAXON_ID=1112570 /ORGANISM="Thraustochytrium sp., Strain LLF1b" /LENGTH=233 /DNA_ID=CAMNT_0026911003 /DNA_START=50 /DNA_END=751 /DNA_ORIENTATION=-
MALELRYLAVRARGETSRMLLKHANKEFKDTVIEWSGLADAKKEAVMPKSSFPILLVDDGKTKRTIFESGAILRYIARVTNLYPEDPLDISRQEELLEVSQLLYGANAVMNVYDVESDKFKENEKEVFDKVEYQFPVLEKLLEEAGTRFFTGDKPYVGDFHLWHRIDQLENLRPGFLKTYPALEGFFKALLEESTGLVSYLKERLPPSELGIPGNDSFIRKMETNSYYKDLIA